MISPEYQNQFEHVQYACSASDAAASAAMFDLTEFKANRQVSTGWCFNVL